MTTKNAKDPLTAIRDKEADSKKRIEEEHQKLSKKVHSLETTHHKEMTTYEQDLRSEREKAVEKAEKEADSFMKKASKDAHTSCEAKISSAKKNKKNGVDKVVEAFTQYINS